MTKTISSQPERQRLKLTLLDPYPLQEFYYTERCNGDFDRLLDDLREHGQRDPIVVFPSKKKRGRFTILDGHDRCHGATLLDWEYIDAIVRFDLVDADDAAVEAVYLSYNLVAQAPHAPGQGPDGPAAVRNREGAAAGPTPP